MATKRSLISNFLDLISHAICPSIGGLLSFSGYATLYLRWTLYDSETQAVEGRRLRQSVNDFCTGRINISRVVKKKSPWNIWTWPPKILHLSVPISDYFPSHCSLSQHSHVSRQPDCIQLLCVTCPFDAPLGDLSSIVCFMCVEGP